MTKKKSKRMEYDGCVALIKSGHAIIEDGIKKDVYGSTNILFRLRISE